MKRSALVTLHSMLGAVPAFSGETDDVLVQIERMASAGEKADRTLGQSIVDGIEKSPKDVCNVPR